MAVTGCPSQTRPPGYTYPSHSNTSKQISEMHILSVVRILYIQTRKARRDLHDHAAGFFELAQKPGDNLFDNNLFDLVLGGVLLLTVLLMLSLPMPTRVMLDWGFG